MRTDGDAKADPSGSSSVSKASGRFPVGPSEAMDSCPAVQGTLFRWKNVPESLTLRFLVPPWSDVLPQPKYCKTNVAPEHRLDAQRMRIVIFIVDLVIAFMIGALIALALNLWQMRYEVAFLVSRVWFLVSRLSSVVLCGWSGDCLLPTLYSPLSALAAWGCLKFLINNAEIRPREAGTSNPIKQSR